MGAWTCLFAVVATSAAVLTALTFSPGFLSYDSLYQLSQARNEIPLSDWHPPVMSVLWRALISLTGTHATMAVVQITALWSALFVAAWLALRVTGSGRWGLAFLGLGLVPQVVNIVGVVWKDVQMALALLVVVVIAMVGQVLRRTRTLTWLLVPLAFALLVYALLVRKNAIVAIVPILFLVWRSWFDARRLSGFVLALGVFAGSAFAAQVVLDALARPQKTHLLSTIAIDDVIHVVPRQQLERSELSPDLRAKLVVAQQRCEEKKSLMNAYWTCYGRGAEGPFTPIADHAELTRAWPGLMAERPAGYLQYRAEVFAQFLFNNRDYWQEGVLANDRGIDVDHPRMVSTLRTYILQFANRNIMFVFGAWFWLVVGVVQALSWRRASRFRDLVGCLGLSSVLYILAYIPTAPATDYRYVYWPAIAGSLGLLVLAMERWAPRSSGDAAHAGAS
jgi:hypothetical protein